MAFDNSDFETLRRLVLQEKRIDLVRLGQFLNFMWTDDVSYESLPEDAKRQPMSALEGRVASAVIRNADLFVRDWTPEQDISHLVCAHYQASGGRVTVIDIGCQYGSSAMQTAEFIRSIGGSPKILAYDCGLAGYLAKFNFANNGFNDDITFFQYAVCALDKYVIVHRDLDYSADNRLVNPFNTWERGSTSTLAQGIRIDTILQSEDIQAPLLVKVDTQGAEPEVMKGAANLGQVTPHALILEFTPAAIAPRCDPELFVSGLIKDYEMFDVGPGGKSLNRVLDVAGLVNETSSRSEQWTDLVLLQRCSTNEPLINQIRALCDD